MQSYGNSSTARWQRNLQKIVSHLDVASAPRVVVHNARTDRPGMVLQELRRAEFTLWRNLPPAAPATASSPWKSLKSARRFDVGAASTPATGRDDTKPAHLFQAYLDLGTLETLPRKMQRAPDVVARLQENAFGIISISETFPVKKPDIIRLRETYAELGCQAYFLPALNRPHAGREDRYVLIVKPETIVKTSRINHPLPPP